MFAELHNTVRTHQGLGNVPIPQQGQIPPPGEEAEPLGKVGCQEWLRGLFKHYYRKAA